MSQSRFFVSFAAGPFAPIIIEACYDPQEDSFLVMEYSASGLVDHAAVRSQDQFRSAYSQGVVVPLSEADSAFYRRAVEVALRDALDAT